MKLRKVLSIVLCLCMILACLPAVGVMAEETAQQTVRIEAENAVFNRYTAGTDAAFSGGGKLGGANGTYYAWDVLSTGEFNKNNWVYVAYYVDAPEAGTYKISVGAKVKMTADCTPYAAILVNPLENEGTFAYQLPYPAFTGTAAIHMQSEQVEVQLIQGRNVIYMTPFTGDQAISWADTDYIEITGDQAVTVIAPQTQKLAANVSYYAKTGNVSATGLADTVFAPINDGGIHAENVTWENMKTIGHTSVTLDVPADGYYDLSYTIAGNAANGSGYFALAMFVDDNETAQVKPFVWNNGLVDVSTFLTAGIHTLTISIAMPENQAAADAYDVAWCDLQGLTISGGLKLATYQESVIHGGNVLEAERDAYAWRYPDTDTNEKNVMLGGAQPGATKQTYDELSGGAALNKNQPMLTYYVEVETAGTYTVNVSSRGYTNDDCYHIISVDDQTYYKATINGADPTRANRWYTTAQVELTAGRHFIRVITLPGDSGAGWCNVDYTAFSGPGGVRAIKDQLHLQSAEAHYYQGFTSTANHSGNGSQWTNALGGYQGGSLAANNGVTTENFEFADLPYLGWFSYTVSVPADGYYDLQTYLRPNTTTSGTGKILLVIDQTFRWVDVTLDSGAAKWWIADLTSYLTAGEHVILVSGILDYTGDPGTDWCDMGALTVSGGITASANPINPLHQGECVLEAEADSIIWRYTTTDNGQVGGGQPAGSDYNQSYDQLVADSSIFEKRHQPSVSYVVDVDTAGEYTLTASYRGYTAENYYIVIAIDDETFVKTAYVGADDTNSAFLLTSATVELTAGRHVIRLLPLTTGTGAGWINLNYLKIEGIGSVENVTDWTHLYAFDAPYIQNFAKGDTAADLSQWGNAPWAKTLGGYQGISCMKNAGVTSENFTLQDLGHMGWFSYTLNVPEDGYYDLQTNIRPNNTTSGTGKILVIIDQAIEWVDVDFGIYPFMWDTVDLSRYLTAGDHTVVISGIVDYTGAPDADWCDMGALSVSGGITLSANQIDPKDWLNPAVESYGLVLNDRIGMKFKLDGYAVGDDVQFYVNGENIDRINLDGGNFMISVAAAQMNDTITVKVNGEQLEGSYTVRGYADVILAGDYSDETKALVRDMLHYGAASQTYFGHNTENLANNGIDTVEREFTIPEAADPSFTGAISGLSAYGASLVFLGQTAVRFYFTGDVTDCVFTVGEQTYEPVQKDDKWYIQVDGIAPDALGETVTLTVTKGEQTITVSYSPMNYIARMYTKTESAELKAALEALYFYYSAAVAYVASIA